MFNQRTARGPDVCCFILTHPERLLLTEQRPLFRSGEADQNFIYLFIYFWLFKTSNVYVDKKNSSKTSEIKMKHIKIT